MGFFKRKDVDIDDAPPSGPQVKGGLKGNGAAKATVLHKKNILTAAVFGTLVVAGAGYYVVQISDSGSAASTQQHYTPANSGPPDMPFPPKQKQKAPAGATAKTTSATAKTKSVAPHVPAPAPAPVAAANTQPPKPTPQQIAFEAAVSGSGQSNLTWGSPAANADGAAPARETAAQAQPQTMPKPKDNVYSTHLVRKEVSPYELLQGTVIPATLETGIKSDLPGQITAVVSQPVYNSVSGAYVLIPAGSKLVGVYSNHIVGGQNRVAVAWTRIEFPNGTYMQLPGMQGSGPRGYAGFHDLVNDHTWEIFKNALLLSLVDVGISISSPTSTSINTTGVTGNEALQDGEQSLAQTFGQAEAQLLQRYINIAPTLTIRPGYSFEVVVTKDLVFPGPYRHGTTEIAPTVPAQPAPPTETNPYG
ncbi:TrbI/VirB10 family protein [Acidithiobacillus caldus]|uniref:TrbI/VirB10 family protein n=1 Tax=Acidithiobacillus caldus TaxID=33059 RepID=UPI0007D9C5BD|nr:TrbI/VirB10 family protein [Acidithiobacillus caldus]QER45258.1 hypothetical protein F0726_02201 [Acidithiobacillus caldus]